MRFSIKNQKIPIPCKKCGYEFQDTFGDIGFVVTCPKCGVKIRLQDNGANQKLEEIEKNINQLLN